MSEYIDREKLLRDIEHYHVSDGKFQHWVEIQPTVDVVPVVRCKDCEYWSGEILGKRCKYHSGLYHMEETNPYDFCSHGVRKDYKNES